MTSAMPGYRLRALGVGVWLVAAGVSPAGGEPVPNEQETPALRHEQWRRQHEESERAESIQRARKEILKNPEQRKFILFRYGLREEDLR